jgi:hypothetical protein
MNSVAVIAGSMSTALFVASTLPMLYKAARTKELGSYSLGYLALANVGNGFYTVYGDQPAGGADMGTARFLPRELGADAALVPALRSQQTLQAAAGVDGATQSSRGRGSVAAWACCTWRLLQYCRCGPLDCLVLEPG